MAREIGGYFELEFNSLREYYPDLLKLNSGRNCLEYILSHRKVERLHLPVYICNALLHPLKKLGIEFDFYEIDRNLNPILKESFAANEALLVINYFGIKNALVRDMGKKYDNIIVDNSQAFFDQPKPGIDTFYSPRKFFGVPDGGYLSANLPLPEGLEEDFSHHRFHHLLKRVEKGAEYGYLDFKKNENELRNIPLRGMSKLTRRLLQSIDYDRIRSIRLENFNHLHRYFKKDNQIDILIDSVHGPLVYPLVIFNKGIKQKMVENKIFLPTYWEEVKHYAAPDSVAFGMVDFLLALPVDQRYNTKDMDCILETIAQILKK